MATPVKTYDDVPSRILKDSQVLSSFFKFIYNYRAQDPAENPFYLSRNQYLIYWPALLAYPRRLKSFAEKVGFSTNIPPPGSPFNAYIRGFKTYFETLLGPLCIPADALVQDYAALQHRAGLQPRNELAGFDNMQNYTGFLRIFSHLGATVRTRIRPPLLNAREAAYLDALPESLHALYKAWHCLRCRHITEDVSDSDFFYAFEEVGVTYLPNGYLFIDWDTFLRCPYAPASLRGKVKPEELYSQLLMLTSPHSLKRCIIARPPEYGTTALSRILRQASTSIDPYIKALVDSGIPQTERAFEKYYTIIDPYALHQKHVKKGRLFNGSYVHHQRERRKRARLAYQHRVATGDMSKARVHPTYRVMLHAKKWFCDGKVLSAKIKECQWFPDDVQETIYFVKHRKVLYFLRPSYPAEQRNQNEFTVFHRALEALKVVLSFTETGELDFDKEKAKGFYNRFTDALREKAYHALLREHLERCGMDEGDTFEVSKRKMNRYLADYVEEKFYENPEAQSSFIRTGTWHSKATAVAATQYLAPHNILIKRLSRLPDEPAAELRTFWSPSAVSMFHDFAKASLGLLKTVDEDESLLGEILYGRPEASITKSPAPYLYAWTLVCQYVLNEYRVRPETYVPHKPRSPRLWTPEEDLYLFKHYTTQPRLVNYISQKRPRYPGGPLGNSWEEILYALPNRSEQVCRQRRVQVNLFLKKVLTPARYEVYCMGNKACTEAEARRAVLLLGCRPFYVKEAWTPRLPFVKYIFNIPEKDLLEMPIPDEYRKSYFTVFAGTVV